MSVSLDKVDTIMKRADVSYEEAKEALENHEGDIVEALIELEKGDKTKKSKKKVKENINEKSCSFFNRIAKEIKKLHCYKFKVKKESDQVLSIPLTIAILIIIFTFPISLIALGALLCIGYKISIKTKDSEVDVKDIIN